MAQAGTNPYARPPAHAGEAPDPSGRFRFGGPGRYSVMDIPESTDPDYTTGYASELAAGGSPDGTALPSDIRVGTREEPENDPNDREYNARRYSNFHKRHSVEEYELDWHVKQRRVPPGQNPLWTQDRPPIRPTADLAPAGYQFTRPWHIPRHVQDALGEDAVTHFSMADHRRVYQIMGQAPRGGLGVNTYRANPRPWDESLFVPVDPANEAGAIFGTRSYRLGG